MADNFVRGSETFRSLDPSGGTGELPIVLAGSHVRDYVGVQSLALSASAQTLTVPSGATHADVYCEGATGDDYARFWHGTNPTAAVGVRLRDHEVVASAEPGEFRAINVSGACTLRVEYYRHL